LGVLDGDERHVALRGLGGPTEFIQCFRIAADERQEVLDRFVAGLALSEGAQFRRRGDPAFLDVLVDRSRDIGD
jgi:hypothetical protein